MKYIPGMIFESNDLHVIILGSRKIPIHKDKSKKKESYFLCGLIVKIGADEYFDSFISSNLECDEFILIGYDPELIPLGTRCLYHGWDGIIQGKIKVTSTEKDITFLNVVFNSCEGLDHVNVQVNEIEIITGE